MIAASIVLALVGGLITSVLGAPPSAEAASPVCSAATAQAGITIAPSHGSVFYIDSAASQRMDAAYLSYVVTSSTARADVWVEIDNFTGGSVTPADPNDTARTLGSVAANTSETAFFLVRAGAPTTRAQSHTVTVYDGMPGLEASTALATCVFSFSQVKETIKANSNKVSSVATNPLDTAGMTLGQTFTVTVEGTTGTIGDGTSSPDRDMMWLTPAARSSWPAGSIRLESTELRVGSKVSDARTCSSTASCRRFTDVLQVKNLQALAASFSGSGRSLGYVAVYTFRVVGATSAAVPIIPVAQISSGTQIKHTTIPQVALGTIKTNDVVVNARTTKSLSTTVDVAHDPLSMTFRYTVRVANNGSVPITVDRVVDDADDSLSVVPGSAVGRTVSSAGVQSALTVRQPSVESATGNVIFSGPLAVPAGGRIEIDYSMVSATCVDGEPFSITNRATAEIGTTIIGTTASTFQQVLASGACGDTVIDPPDITDETIPPEVVTLPPSAVGDTSATLEGTADPNGVAGSTVRFEWGTDPDFLVAASKSMGTTSTATTPQAVSGPLTGLQPGTVYYYRLVVDLTVGGVTTSYYGKRQMVTTTEPVAAPVVTTLPATGVSTAGATLNGSIDPNQTSSFIAFSISKTSTLPAASTTRVVILDDQELAFHSTNNPYTPFGGSFSTPFSLTLAQAGLSLTPGDTWYYRADIVDGSGAVLSSGTIRSVSLVVTAPQSVAFDPVTNTAVTAGSTSARASATSGLPPSVRSETPAVCRIETSASGVVSLGLLAVGECTLVADQEGGTVGGTVYEPAAPVSTTFAVTRAGRTLALDPPADLDDWAAAPPHLDALPSAGADDGVIHYRVVDSAGVCRVDADTGIVTIEGPGVCSVAADITAGARHVAASASTVSFTIGRRTQELLLPDASVPLSSSQLELDADSSATTNTDGLGAIEYALVADDVNSAGCTIVGVRLTASRAGTCLVEARRNGNAFWSSAATRALITVSDKAGRQIVLRVPTESGHAPVPTTIDDWSTREIDVVGVPSETDPADQVTYSTMPGTDACEIDASTGRVTITGAGDCVLRTSVGETASRTGATSSSTTIRIGPRPQSITDFTDTKIPADSDHVDLTSGTSATSNTAGLGDPEYRIDPASTDGCSILQGRLAFTQAGSCIVTVVRGGNAHWKAAEGRATITIERVSRGIGFDDPTRALEVTDWSAAPHSARALPTAGVGDGAVSYDVDAPTGACRIDPASGLLEFRGAGTCTLRAAVSQGARYTAADADVVTLIIGKRTQVITGLSSATRWATVTSLALAPQSNASVNDADMDPVSLVLIDDGGGACRLVDGDLAVDAAGECIVEAARPGNAHWTTASARATLTFDRAPRTLSLSTIMAPTPTWRSSPPRVLTRISHDTGAGTVRYSVVPGSACSIDPITGELTLLRAGTCTVDGLLSPSARYTGASSDPLTFMIDRAPQSITNLPSGTITTATTSIPLSALSDATTLDDGMGPIAYRVDGACTADGDVLLVMAAGTCTVTASRDGNDNWTSAVSVSQLRIDRIPVTAALRLSSGRTSIPAGTTDRALLSTSLPHPGVRTWSATSGVCTVDITGAIRALAAGTCVIRVSIPATDRLSSATATLSVVITTAPPPPTSDPTPPPPVGPSSEPSTGPSAPPRDDVTPTPQTVEPRSGSGPDAGAGAPTTLREPIGLRTIPELSRESVGGFAPGSVVRAELAGARTVGQFVVAAGALDEVAVIDALEASAGDRAGGFAAIRTIERAEPDSAALLHDVGPALTRLFSESRLGLPRPVGDLDVDRAERWVRVVVDVDGLRPQSRVALAVTTDPIVVGDAVARDDGTATVTGWVPLDLLEAGPHSIRVAGVRELRDATVDATGSVRMTDEIIAQVQEFDPGTAATITITGSTSGSATVIAQRRVLLDDITPWWALVLLGAGVAVIGIARKRREEWTARCRGVALGVVGALAMVVVVAGWYTAAYGIYGLGAVLAGAGVLVAALPGRQRPRRRRAARRAENAVVGDADTAFA